MLAINLNCRFQDFHLAVKQTIPANKIVGLFGASGSGKSKFIRQVVGLDPNSIEKASIRFNNLVWCDHEKSIFIQAWQRGIGYLPQSIDLFPHLTVLQNIRFAQQHNYRDGVNLDFDTLITNLDVKDLLERFPHQLSGGQKQRVGLARAIIASENLLLLDEPFSAQGETHKSRLMNYLQSLNQTHQLTILFASHDRIEHAFLSQYLMTFNQGKVIQSDDYQKVATDIKGSFAQTTDSINHLPAIASHYHNDYYLNQLNFLGHSVWAGDTPLQPGTKVLLEIKATDISLSKIKNNQSSIVNSLPVSIVDYAEVAKHQYLIKLEFADIFLTTFITKKSFIELQMQSGMSMFAQFKSVSILPFELAETKQDNH
jgi:molybdate transport system ATP-binding protein